MPLVKEFVLDSWIARNRSSCKTFLHDSCIAPLTLAELSQIGSGSKTLFADNLPLSYGTIRGSLELRSQVASLFKTSSVTADDVLITPGAISANFLILDTLLGPGDHVVCQYPTYGQLFEVPRRAGAAVDLWRQCEDDGWSLKIADLIRLVRPNTKMIIVNNPSNPSGAVLKHELLEQIVQVAKDYGIIIMSDEVFRPLFHVTPHPPSLLDLGYERTIVTGSLSKAYALPGIRIGWVAMHPSLRDNYMRNVAHARDYTSIAVSQLDDQVASFALEPSVRVKILARSSSITQSNITLLRTWVSQHPRNVRWTPPKGAGTCVVTILDNHGLPVDDATFAEQLAHQEGVLAPPISICFGNEPLNPGPLDHSGLRIGVVLRSGILQQGLEGIDNLMRKWGLTDLSK